MLLLQVKDTQIGELHRLMATTALKPWYGVVVYEFVTPEVLRGYWTTSNQTAESVLGFEECRKFYEEEA